MSENINQESYADVFIEFMNIFQFDQKDMINQDDRVEYVAYLKNMEKTLAKKSNKEINIFGKNKNDQKECQYKKLRFTITSVHSTALEQQA